MAFFFGSEVIFNCCVGAGELRATRRATAAAAAGPPADQDEDDNNHQHRRSHGCQSARAGLCRQGISLFYIFYKIMEPRKNEKVTR